MNYLKGHILYQIVKIILIKHQNVADNPPIRIYVNNIENSIATKIKTGYCLKFLNFETMKLLGSTESKIIKDENGENTSHLKTTEEVLKERQKIINDLRLIYYNNGISKNSKFIN